MIRQGLALVPSQGISFHSCLHKCLAKSWAFVFLATALYAAEPAPTQAPAKPLKDTPTEVLLERKSALQAEMRRMDSEYQLIPYRFRELDGVVKEIDTELAKRQPAKSEKPVKK